MPATPKEAFDDILTLFRTAWEAETAAIAGAVPAVIYPAQEKDTLFDQNAVWARVSISHGQRTKATISGAGGQRRYRPTGTLTVQIYVPALAGQDTLSIAQDLIRVVTDAFENAFSPNGVEFFDVIPQEQGVIGGWFLSDVSMTFRYDEIR